MMRVLGAHVYHESNTFCLEKTRLEDFEIREGADMLPYLPGDCLKIVVSVILAPRILKAMERNS